MFNWINKHILKFLAFMIGASALGLLVEPNVSWLLGTLGWVGFFIVQKELREK